MVKSGCWRNRITWGGLVKSISKKWNIQEICHDQSSDALAFTCGLNMETTFVWFKQYLFRNN